ncbi:Molybdenum cofactor biosynthesis bifunctional protein [Cyphomyrmex costatus]|uniref:Molybdenum cofactor biosynthesis bifunctional protein n=1 Tax=Cyphomyrmex costatus TaxID=456900 RepID=A0A151IC12_9HYME|nr:Molybdenum cofactor biosynthesis bifunctional protein [Cyphomyrmex costatus]
MSQEQQAAVITVSDRSAAGHREDLSGPLAVQLLTDRGWRCRTAVVPDEVADIRAAVRAEVARGARLVVTSGGTGVSPRDVTPEAMDGLFDKELPGVADALRRRGESATAHALLSRGRAGTAGGAFVVNLPGSPGGVRDGIPLVAMLAEHVLDQLGGEDHA